MQYKDYSKNLLKFLILGVIFVIVYLGLGRLFNLLLSPEERLFEGGFGIILGLIPIIIYFGLYGLFKVDNNQKKARFLLKFRRSKALPILFFLSSGLSIVLHLFLLFISLFFPYYIANPWESGGFGIFLGFLLFLLFLQAISGLILIIYFFIVRRKLKDKASYYLFGLALNIIAIVYYLLIYHHFYVIGFSM